MRTIAYLAYRGVSQLFIAYEMQKVGQTYNCQGISPIKAYDCPLGIGKWGVPCQIE